MAWLQIEESGKERNEIVSSIVGFSHHDYWMHSLRIPHTKKYSQRCYVASKLIGIAFYSDLRKILPKPLSKAIRSEGETTLATYNVSITAF